MIRRIIHIDEDKCIGCGACVDACHEAAIGMVDGKAKLLRDDYCDGLGDCLPSCPTEAITFVEREAAVFDEAAVSANKATTSCETSTDTISCGCPGTQSKVIIGIKDNTCTQNVEQACCPSQLSQWPVQIKLVPVTAPYFNGANLLIAADCTAYAYGDFHNRFIKNRITLVGCPKLDQGDYSEKLTEIIRNNNIKRVTVVRMEVPCCSGLEHAVVKALKNSGKFIPWQVVTISSDGKILD